ncbi:hypothetical protein [Acidovorax sp. 93]|uniref:hypothetical protein n=1 Tax=Acidovorax sp. 93 TaxID=2135632 RepID=UPI0011C3A2B2|nr:hypothetical protein [Acidovorax sp. 93]
MNSLLFARSVAAVSGRKIYAKLASGAFPTSAGSYEFDSCELVAWKLGLPFGPSMSKLGAVLRQAQRERFGLV